MSKAMVASKERLSTLRDVLEAKKSTIAALLPQHLHIERLIKVALVAASRNPLLLECDQLSILKSVMTCAQLGLEPDSPLGEAHLVPFRNNRANRMEATFIAGYRGLLKLIRRSGELASIGVHVVYEGDEFECEFGLEPKLRHVPKWDRTPKAEIKCVYAIAHLKGGGVQADVMTLAEVEAVRKRSRSGSNGPWVSDFSEMARKTVLKRLAKYLPLSIEADRAIATDTAVDVGEPTEIDLVLPESPESETLMIEEGKNEDR